MRKDIKEEKNFKKFLIVQYTGGAGGRAICSCIQTAKNIVPWFKSLPNPVEFALKHTNDLTHVRSEPDAEYKLPWLSRTYGVERGNDLSNEEVNNLIDENKFQKAKNIFLSTGISINYLGGLKENVSK